MSATPSERSIFSVSELAREARVLIESHFQTLWVEGELSNFRRPSSGHWYFTLKDAGAQIRVAMFAGRNRAHRREPRDGDRVLLRGRLSLYEPRGDFQFIAEHLEPAGAGALRAAFEALKARLDAEGLFAAERKRPLPEMPRQIAVISSATGAALRDVIDVLRRRFPIMKVILLPVAVQGDAAGGEIVAALERVATLDVDAVLLTRGGGSLEDLWAFNLEEVARAVASCPLPTVSAIGHQTDFTITDFVADVRAPTPSAGAELLTPDRRELLAQLDQVDARLTRATASTIQQLRRHLGHLRARLVSPQVRLQQQMQRADDLEERLARGLQAGLTRSQSRLLAARRALALVHPGHRLRPAHRQLESIEGRLSLAINRRVEQRRAALHSAVRTLEAMSPLATLARGYAVLSVAGGGGAGTASGAPEAGERRMVTSIETLAPGHRLTAHLEDGALDLLVEAVSDDNRLPDLPILET